MSSPQPDALLPRRRPEATRLPVVVEPLEVRWLLSNAFISNGGTQLNYIADGGESNNLTITLLAGTFTLTDPAVPITAGAGCFGGGAAGVAVTCADTGVTFVNVDLSNLGEIDWKTMPLPYWADSDETKERRQAEFLVHQSFPWSAVERIAVRDAALATQIQGFLGKGQPPVEVQSGWYY